MAGKLPMGQKELTRVKVMEMVKEKQKTLRDAAKILKVSYRQAKRIYKKFREKGDAGMVHGNCGKSSHNSIETAVRKKIVRLYSEKYNGFGPTFASEKMSEFDKAIVDHETLRRWLIEEGLWQRKRRRHPYRQRRDRREGFGELLQFDGSHHDWFEGRGPKCCLMNMVDDATGITDSFLVAEETTEAAMLLLQSWILRHGIPQAVYCDRKNAFVTKREPSIEDQLKGDMSKGPFEKACEKLGIEIIVANSPQAKGRVERNHAVYQDRFVKELRLRGISTMDDANRFLAKEYLPSINKKFSRKPLSGSDVHVPLLKNQDLKNIFCFDVSRVVSNDYVVQAHGVRYQILKENERKPVPGNRIIVRRWLDKSVHFFFKDKELLVRELKQRYEKEKAYSLSA